MNPPRTCALCDAKIKFKQRLCPSHCAIYKNQMTWDDNDRVYKVGDLTEPWLRSIIEYSAYAYNVELRDVGRVEPLENISRKV